MKNKQLSILVVFVEPMLYNMDLVHEVYEQTPYDFQYIYCHESVTGRDDLKIPNNSQICKGKKNDRKQIIKDTINNNKLDFVIINGYVGIEQTTAIRCCKKRKIPYAIESDTPLHIPGNIVKASLKKLFLRWELANKLCYGFPGGTLQKNNLKYYGIPEKQCFIMPMSVSEKRLIEESKKLPTQEKLKEKYKVKGKKVFLFVGRLEVVKNVALLVQAFDILKNTHEDIAMFIVGDGSQTEKIKKNISEKNIEDIYFMGYLVFPYLVEFYKMADVFVLPSTYEPWGLVINEASILDLPVVVSTDVGCKEDLVHIGNNGYVFESNNVCDLVDKLEKSLKMGKIKEKVTDDWNLKKYLKNFTEALERVCIDQ